MNTYELNDSISSRRALRSSALIALVAVPLATACSDARVIELAEASVTVPTHAMYGARVPIGNGTGRTYVIMQADRMVEVGVALTEGTMDGLPVGAQHHGSGHPHLSSPFVLEMPEGQVTPFRFVGLDWNSKGHEPPGIYDAPHFDIHFFTISQAERDAIVPTAPGWSEKAAKYPDRSFIPEGYADLATVGGVEPAMAAVPQMGMHWVDANSPELHGQTFTETFIYGTWDGEVIFVEPMITREFFLGKPDFVRNLPVASKGLSPASYRIYWDESSREYRVALQEFGGKR